MRFEDFAVGQMASLERVVTAEDVSRFAELSGDDNPLHLDDEYASSLGLGGRVVHGMLTASYVSTVVGTMLPGPGALWLSEAFRFRAPVRVGDRIVIELTIRQVSPATRILVLDVVVRNQLDRVVLDGEASVHVLGRVEQVSGARAATGTVVVTGAARGIGAAIAERLAAAGLPVVINFNSSEAQAQETATTIREAGGDASVFQADVSNADAVAALMAHAVDTHGPVEVLVNNAGAGIDRLAITELAWEHMQRPLDVYLRGSFLCTQAVLPGMVDRGFGRIVNITSQAGYGVPPPKMAGYVVAKAALAAWSRCLAQEVGPSGVTVNAIAPGMIDTGLVADVPQSVKLAVAAQSPLRHLPTAQAVADIVEFLAGPAAAELTGQTLHLSGGQVMT
jgi:3-oxoacyl-[acyl-carrier protein] reductase